MSQSVSSLPRRPRASALALALLLSGCSYANGAAQQALLGASTTGGSPQPALDAGAADSAGDAAEDVAAKGVTGGPSFLAPLSTCPGGDRCACAVAADCASGVCVETARGHVCAASCASGVACLPSEACVAYLPESGTETSICAPRFVSLCAPCQVKADCQAKVAGDAVDCVGTAATGKFCATACASDANCPSGFACQGSPGFCAPASGTCECSFWAVAHATTAACSVPTKYGACSATVSCQAPGPWPECPAPQATFETCNGVDDDCNGITDDVAPTACDDNNPCTKDTCTAAACQHTPNVTCGDGVCAEFCGETPASCPADCHICGDGKCETGESPQSCPGDCCGWCGDGVCDGNGCGEDQPGLAQCSLDCGG